MSQKTSPKTDDDVKIKRYNKRYHLLRFSKEEKAKLSDLADKMLEVGGRVFILIGKWFLQDECKISEEQFSEMDELNKTANEAIGEGLIVCGNCVVRHALNHSLVNRFSSR